MIYRYSEKLNNSRGGELKYMSKYVELNFKLHKDDIPRLYYAVEGMQENLKDFLEAMKDEEDEEKLIIVQSLNVIDRLAYELNLYME